MRSWKAVPCKGEPTQRAGHFGRRRREGELKHRLAPCLALIALCSGLAWAAPRPAWVIPEVLNVRKEPSADSDKAGRVTRGDQVLVTAFRADRWCKALLPNGKTGWLKEEYLQFSQEKGRELAKQQSKTPLAIPAWIAESVVNMRKGPDVGAGVVTQLKRGYKVHVIARDGNWRKVTSNGGERGWIRADLLEFDLEEGRKLASGSGRRDHEPTPAWVNANVANVRTGPSTGYSRAGQLTKGTKVHVLERQDEWAKCKGPDCTGWIHTELLETDAAKGRELASAGGSSGRDKAYCIGNMVRLREGPGTGHDLITELREGATLWIVAEKNEWCKVETQDGETGWIAGWYVRRHGARTTVSQAPDSAPLDPPGNDFPSASRPPEEGKLQPFKAWIAEDHTNVRYGPGLEKGVKFQLDKHAPVQVVDTEGQWCKVRTDSDTYGWTAGWVLDFQPPGRPEASKVVNGEKREIKAGWIDRPVVNLRQGPTTDTEIAVRTKLGDELVIIDRRAGWLKVAMSDGTTGWIAEHLIKTRAESLAGGAGAASLSHEGSSRGHALVRAAMAHLGKAYVRGTSGPGTFDCSGFTSYIYRQFGVSLPRTSSGQYRTGRPVSRDELQQGDVVIFKNTYRSGISHVGIYIGQGNFIHASNSRSGVKITSLDSAYYAPRYVGARRLF